LHRAAVPAWLLTTVDQYLPNSNRVEVLTDGDSVVINVVTRPAVGGDAEVRFF